MSRPMEHSYARQRKADMPAKASLRRQTTGDRRGYRSYIPGGVEQRESSRLSHQGVKPPSDS